MVVGLLLVWSWFSTLVAGWLFYRCFVGFSVLIVFVKVRWDVLFACWVMV